MLIVKGATINPVGALDFSNQPRGYPKIEINRFAAPR